MILYLVLVHHSAVVMNKMHGFWVSIVLLICLTAAYDFDTSDFNEYLANEMEYYTRDSISDFKPTKIFKRDEEAVLNDKCKYRKKRLCCAETSMEELHEKEKEVKRECFKEVLGKDKEPRGMDPFKCENMEKHRKDMICVMQCVGKRNDILDLKGNIKEAPFGDFIKQSFTKDPWFEKIQNTIIETCIKEAKNTTESWNSEDKNACNPTGIKLAHCVFVQTQINCPESEIKDAKVCSKLKERIKAKMPDSVPPPPPFLHDE